MRLDEASAAGDIRIDGLTVESLSNFSSARATTAIFKARSLFMVSVFLLRWSLYEMIASADRLTRPAGQVDV